MAYFLSPVCNAQEFDASGNPLVGGQILTYLAGSTTPTATYTSVTGLTAQGNPIILNTLGLPASPIWLNGGVAYKFIVKDAGGTVLQTIDNISGVNDASITVSEWINSGFVPTFTSATTFSVPGDQTQILQVNRRLRTQNTAGFIYSFITAASFAAGITTVTVVNDSGVLDAGLSKVEYGLLSATNKSIPQRITGTVAQVGGFPTGSIIERGTNANGEFVKFADGTLVCTYEQVPVFLNNSNIGFTWTFPSVFIVTPKVFVNLDSSTLPVAKTITSVSAYSRSTTNAVCSIFSVGAFVAGDVTGTNLNTLAVGRWF